MPCTTILVGKHASYDGSTMAARSEDAGGTHYDPKKFAVMHPEDQPRHYRSVLTHVEIELPENPMRYTMVPNGIPDEGIWAAAGVNEAGVSMTATETITSNERVLGADPLVELRTEEDGTELPGGIGEEDMVVLVLPYIRSAREGVLRLGSLLETFGTNEMNGIAFQDRNEIWWLETIGGHHWIARRLPDDCYAVIPNQLGIDTFDLTDAFEEGKEHLCSGDLWEFIRANHLDLQMQVQRRTAGEEPEETEHRMLNARDAFGSHSDSDHCYNTPRAWFAQRYLNPHAQQWDGSGADDTPLSDTLPWARRPEKKVTVGDIKYILSSHYQDTVYDPYSAHGDRSSAGAFRPIGVNRNNFSGLVQLGRYRQAAAFAAGGISGEAVLAVEWLCFGSNTFNAMFPIYTFIHEAPEYISNTTECVTTENCYWANRMIAVMADTQYHACIQPVERYQQKILAKGNEILHRYDPILVKLLREPDVAGRAAAVCEQANTEMISFLKEQTQQLLDQVLLISSQHMKNSYSRADH